MQGTATSSSSAATSDPTAAAQDVEEVAQELEQNPQQAIALHELRKCHSVTAAPETPIPRIFFERNAIEFSWGGSLVPAPIACLWQDVHPEIPFGRLLSQDARSMVSVCRLYSQYRKKRQVVSYSTHGSKYVDCYEHVAGQTSTRSRCPQDDVACLG